MMNFDLSINTNSMPSAIDPSCNQHGTSSNPSSIPQLQFIQPSVEAESNTLPTKDEGEASGGSAVGAGPLPHSYRVPPVPGTGSTLTEFTKRRNWSQRVIEELRDILHILSPDGRLLYVSPSTRDLTGYESQDIVGKLISDYVHPDDSNVFIREFNESIASGNPLRFFYRFLKKDGQYTIFEAHGHPHLASEAASFGQNANAGASFCRGFFMMSRPYPTRNAALLDSFLEHKIENERLRKRIAELKREEQEDVETQQQVWANKQLNSPGNSSQSPHAQPPQFGDRPSTSPDYNGMPPPAKRPMTDNALTRHNLDEALATSQHDSINDKMARYEGANHFGTIEMLTGLRYREGERSKGISTGDASPILIRGDAGITFPADKDGRPAQGDGAQPESPCGKGSHEKKKKFKAAEEYVCNDCGTLDSPEWRKGPGGPKTLCNACGLRWAKKEKKKNEPDDPPGDEVNANIQANIEGSVPAGTVSSSQSASVAPPTQAASMMAPSSLPNAMSLNAAIQNPGSMPPQMPATSATT